ncbi:hypothetical protein [Gordonia effusa]|uniref:hypothetical protein n=1 Tax=Gordonia effusa TaxID=263908 RepID=UPI0003089E2D|nr:hypothetical protein [Gordonia effusa]
MTSGTVGDGDSGAKESAVAKERPTEEVETDSAKKANGGSAADEDEDESVGSTKQSAKSARPVGRSGRGRGKSDGDSRASRWAEQGVRVPFLGLVALGVAFLVAVSVLGYLYWQESDRNSDLEGTVAAQRQTEQNRSAALAAAKDFLFTANNIDYTNLDPWFKQMTERSTGAFRDSYQPVQSGIGEVIKASQLKITGKISQAAISSQTDTTIRVLALVDQKVQSIKLTKETPVATAMYVDLMQDKGVWKVFGMNQAADQTVQSPENNTGIPVPGAPAATTPAPAPTP